MLADTILFLFGVAVCMNSFALGVDEYFTDAVFIALYMQLFVILDLLLFW